MGKNQNRIIDKQIIEMLTAYQISNNYELRRFMSRALNDNIPLNYNSEYTFYGIWDTHALSYPSSEVSRES